jgi:hypothetical protein
MQAAFTKEEWRTLQFAPLWTFTAVAGADREIDDKEMAALAKELAEAPLYKDPLVREVLSTIVNNLAQIMREYAADSRDVLGGLGEVADLLDRKVAAEEAQSFKRAMLFIGHNIAEASGGGLFGRGEKTSDEEKAALVIVAASLRIAL